MIIRRIGWSCPLALGDPFRLKRPTEGNRGSHAAADGRAAARGRPVRLTPSLGRLVFAAQRGTVESMHEPVEHPQPQFAAAIGTIDRRTMRERWQARQRARSLRFDQAWGVARAAAELLRVEFGARRVVAFGSLTHRDRFRLDSDIDLAAWGVEGIAFYTAVARLNDLSPEFRVDLVDPESCPPCFARRSPTRASSCGPEPSTSSSPPTPIRSRACPRSTKIRPDLLA